MKVQEVMTKQLECITPGATVHEAAQKMESVDVGVLPVMQDSTAVGVLTDRDITVRAIAKGLDPKSTKVSEIMTGDLQYVSQDDDVKKAAKTMQKNKIRRVLVKGDGDKAIGILSLGDVAVDVDDELAGETLEDVSEPAKPKR